MTSFDALTDLENLRLFLQERIRVVDPSLDTGVGSELDTEVIQPLLDRLGPDPYDTPIRDFIIGRLQTEFPDLILQDGEPIDDYAVKVMQILLEPFRRQIQQISNNQSLANPELLSDTEGDNLGANYFVPRELGGFATGAARIYFSAPQYAQVAASNVVTTGSGLRFFPVETQAITLDSMLFNTEDNLYYFDVIVRAEAQGDEYNIEENTLTSIADLPAAVKVSNKLNFEGGLERESTEDYLARVERSLSEKSLVTLRGVTARLTEIFETIRLLAVIGAGDPEMNRDIIEGVSASAPYAYGTANNPPGAEITVSSIFTEDGGLIATGVPGAGVQIGDIVTQFDFTTYASSQHTITRIIDSSTIEVTPNVVALSNRRLTFRKPNAGITISDIPGGITGGSSINLVSGQVHIGGAMDVYVRAGDPQPRNTTIEGVLDGSPLHFGVDLESFGDDPALLTILTHPIGGPGGFFTGGIAMVVNRDIYGEPLSVTNQILILDYVDSSGLVPWRPTESDVGRYVQLIGDGGGLFGEFGTFGILAVGKEEYCLRTTTTPYEYYRCVRITIGDATTGQVYDEESGYVREGGFPLSASTSFDTWCRVVDKISRKSVVRDRDGTNLILNDPPEPDVYAGTNFSTLGTEVGDSVVVETGDDAGIYSVRRILSWLGTDDALVLDRALTKTLEPSGNGDGTGLRYRIADELNVDLVSPKVTKIPLGSIFTGNDLDSVAGSTTVTVAASTNFLLAGVEEGDTLEVLSGDNAGTYQIVSVTGTTAVLDSPMLTAAFSQSFSVYRAYTGIDRPLVRVKTIELLDSSSQPTGITVPYGDAVDARVLGILGNRAEGTEVESFTGVTGVGGGPEVVRLSDANRDFVAEGITAGYRLNIFNTLNAGEYTIASVTSGYVDVELAAGGGLEFRTSEGGIHYSIGLPSSGFVRLYFQEPTSVEIQTGLDGGRLLTDDDSPREFRFSEVEGYAVLPPGGSGETFMRDLNVVRSRTQGLNFNTFVEFTDTSNPSAFESEVQEGDVLDVYEEIKFRNLKPLNATYTWNGTGTVASSDTTEVHVGHYIRLDSDGRWFEITAVTPGVSVTIDPVGLTPPTGATQSSASATFEQLGIVGSPAGLRSVAGSNLISIPTGSLIDFSAMNDISDLVGQTIHIADGPDEGDYAIEEVVGPKQLRVDRVLTVTTESVVSQGGINTAQYPQRDAYLEPSGLKTNLVDPTNNPGTIPEQYITIFESTRGDFDGTYQVTDVPTPGSVVELDADPSDPGGDIPNPKDLRTLIGASDQSDGALAAGVFSDPNDNLRNAGVRIGDVLTVLDGPAQGRYIVRTHPTAGVGGSMTVSDLSGAAPPDDPVFNYEIEASGSVDVFGIGRFNWVLTANESPLEQSFRVYNAAPTEVEIIEIAPVAPVNVPLNRGYITDQINFYDFAGTNLWSANKGDLLEILKGPNAGVYPIKTRISDGHVQIYGSPSPNVFFVAETDIPYKVWGGLHGRPRMVKVGPWQSFDGRLEPGVQVPYKLRRPKVHRVGSTEMAENVDNNLYYTDVQIESQGSGDLLNLAEGTRLVVDSGMTVDGYRYTVDNNRLTFSPYEEVSIDFDRRFLPVGNSDNPENLTEISGRNIKITYESSPVTRLVDDLLHSDFDRPINADPMARHFLPSYVFVSFVFSGSGLSANEIGQEIEDAVNRAGAETSLKVSELEAIITRRGATYVQHPITLVSITHDIDRNLVVDRSEDTLGGYNVVSFNGSGRTSAFFAILGEGLTVEKI